MHILQFQFQIHPWLPIVNGVIQKEKKPESKEVKSKLEDKMAEENIVKGKREKIDLEDHCTV